MSEATGCLEATESPLGAGEVSLAGEVQHLLLPKSSPACTWCCMGVKNRMARVMGGDFYDFIELPDGCQVIFLGDVTGHGLHASIVMSLAYGFLHRAVQEGCDPRRTISDLNEFLRSFAARSEPLDHHFSATLFFGVIDPKNLNMCYINAGHPAGLVRRDQELLRLEATSHPIGYFDQPDFRVTSFDFQTGDRLLLFTDGLADGMNAGGEMFGARRLELALGESGEDSTVFLNRLFADLDRFMAGQAILDDCTGIVIDFHRAL